MNCSLYPVLAYRNRCKQVDRSSRRRHFFNLIMAYRPTKSFRCAFHLFERFVRNFSNKIATTPILIILFGKVSTCTSLSFKVETLNTQSLNFKFLEGFCRALFFSLEILEGNNRLKQFESCSVWIAIRSFLREDSPASGFVFGEALGKSTFSAPSPILYEV